MTVDVNRELHLLQLSNTISHELIQRPKTFPVMRHSAHWQQLRTHMGQLTHGMKRCRLRSADGEELTCRASMLHRDFWLEALDEQHRYGFHLRAFHKVWKHEMTQDVRNCREDASFFHWLDHGNGKNVDLPECTQQELRTTCVEYCNAEQRKKYEVKFVSDDGNVGVQYAVSGRAVHTDERSKWIFVMDLSGRMYLGRKRKGRFHHSSFVSGAPIFAAGKIIIKNGVIIAIEPHSGHFKPRLENLLALCSMLAKHGVDIDDIAFIKPKKWTCAWPFPPQPDLELEDFATASDTDYGADKSDSEEPQTLLPESEEQ
ncbi:Iq calmodulin-binding motif protein [Phytophthora palmivora]|uniref:Iq calmodulin-binding motif protein n=1 Tax=Phytophthora palmivora TaxID=4796 RepID=A0A2P4YMD2_9STRA|nr:Iq calmodulin-binding motif protein [Phytophthora palmivora]